MTIINAAKKCMPAVAFTLLAACDRTTELAPDADADVFGSTPASAVTEELNRQVSKTLPFANREDFEEARRGLIAKPDSLKIPGPNGVVAWEPATYNFIEGDAPASVNPSLWRQAQLNNIHGLFKVTEGVYQVRGFDLANLT
ncbi:MAG: alkyl sulfatase BDS1-like metallo-beta-lactamase superfamily hydrolase, partial [Bacteroidia bacterium]